MRSLSSVLKVRAQCTVRDMRRICKLICAAGEIFLEAKMKWPKSEEFFDFTLLTMCTLADTPWPGPLTEPHPMLQSSPAR